MKKLKLKVTPNETGRPVRSPLCVKLVRQCPRCIDFIAGLDFVKPEHLMDVVQRDGRVFHYLKCWDVFICQPEPEPEPEKIETRREPEPPVCYRRKLRFA
jgi:hypothetical protein